MRASFIPAFLLASITSVFALNLNDMDALSTKDVTPGCLSAYSTDISACPSASDFKAQKPCTDSCISALNTEAQNIILACRQAFVYPDSLLRRVLDGGLVITLCPATKSSVASSQSYAPATSTSTKTASTTITSTSDSLSGFLTMTISSPATSISSVPSELTLDGSAEPTVDSASAFAQASSSAPAASSVASEPASTASTSGIPSASASSNSTGTQDGSNGAGSVKAVWATVMAGFSVALGATLL